MNNRKSILTLGSAFLFAGLLTAYSQTPLLHYTFDEASGNALDYGSGTAADGAYISPATRTTDTPAGYSDGALNAVPANAYLTTPDADKLDGLGPLTLTAWINLQGNPANGNRVMSKQVASGNFDGFSFAISTPSSGTISSSNFRLNLGLGGAGGFGFFVSGQNISAANEWLFVAVSYDGTGAVNFYTGDDASSVGSIGSALLAGVATPGALVANDRDFRVAAQSSGTVSAPIMIDDVRVYGSVLNLTELDGIRLSNVPEPSIAALFGGFALLLGIRRWKNRV
jgi:hypothetical protein